MNTKSGFALASMIIFAVLPACASASQASDKAAIQTDLAIQDAANAKGDTSASEQFDTQDFEAIDGTGTVFIHSKAQQIRVSHRASATMKDYIGHTTLTGITFSGNLAQVTANKVGSFEFSANGRNYKYTFSNIVIQTWTKASGKWMEKMVKIKSNNKKIVPV